MKKLYIVLIALVMSLQATAGMAEETGDIINAYAEMPDPIVAYDSLEQINTLIGVNLMRPAAAETAKESFSVIDGTIAQYGCEINGLEWTFRGAYITAEDISGVYSEYNEFIPYQDAGLYTNSFYLERFFDGDRQYTIVVKDPISEEGDIRMDEEAFLDICMELESIQKQHMDDPVVGDYQDAAAPNITLYMERHGDVYNIAVNRLDSETVSSCWTMYGAVINGDKLSYNGEEIGRYIYDEEGNEASSEVTTAEAPGFFEIRDGMLYWTGAVREECRACVFEKIIYED